MSTRDKIHFIAANYSQLQGLRAVPPGLVLLSLTLWANFTSGPSRNLITPILLAVTGALLYWIIDRYYKDRFGATQPKREERLMEIIRQILFGITGLAAFWVDTLALIPLSLIGFVFALSYLYEYIRISRIQQGKGLSIYLIFAGLITLVSISPSFGLSQWWTAIGMREQMVGVIVVTSVLVILSGILGHHYLRKSLPVERS